MTESYKKLASLAPESDHEKVLYAAPAATSSLISNITVTNRSSSSATFDVNVYSGGATTDAELYSLEYGKKFYVASAGAAGGLYSSTDGITYDINDPTYAYVEWKSVPSFGNDTWILIRETAGTSWTSTDGITYADTTVASGINGTNRKIKSVFGAGVHMFSGTSGGYYLRKTTDGITWESSTTPISRIYELLIYAQDKFVAVGEQAASQAVSSTDGITWTQRTIETNVGGVWNDIAFGNGVFVALGSQQMVARSTDAITWTSQTLPSDMTANSSIAFGKGIFAALAGSGGGTTATYSTDAITWTVGTTPSTIRSKDMKYGNGTFSAPGYNNAGMLHSTDGIEWISSSSLPSGRFAQLSFVGPFASPNSKKLYSSLTIAANETLVLEPGAVIPASASIVIKDRSSGNLTFSAYGVELS